MKKIILNIPETIDLDDNEVKLLIASKLYESGKLSLGQAADLTGLSKKAFIEILNLYGVSVFNHPASELERDIENAKNYNL